MEATFPPNGSNLSRLWKQGFHPLDEQTVEKVKEKVVKVVSATLYKIILLEFTHEYIYVIKTTFTTFILHPKYCL
jgi:D-alanyl-lipoteichoic acid acyltransferase DltB (MBOAT superfamily)